MNRSIRMALGAVCLASVASACDAPDEIAPEVPLLHDDGKGDDPIGSDGLIYHLRRDGAGIPRKVRLDESVPVIPGGGIPAATAEALALAFLRRNAALFRLRPDLGDLRLEGTDGAHVDFVQTIGGRPLFGAGLRLEVDPRGRIALAHNRYQPGLGPAPGRGRLDVGDALAAAAQVTGLDNDWTAEEGWALDGRDRVIRPVPAWQVRRGATDLLLDGNRGQVLWRDDRVREVRGVGAIYGENAWVDPETVEGALEGLVPTGALQGPHVRVLARDAADGTASDFVFDFPPGSSGFGQVMVYHHLDQVLRWLGELGLQPRGRAIPVHVRAFRQLSARFDPAADAIFLGATNRFDTSQDADVLVHELGHAVVQAYAPALLGRHRGLADAALHEAYGDYLSCAYFGNPLVGAAFHQALWQSGTAADYLAAIGFEPERPGRRCDSDRVWPADASDDPHVTGMIVSGALWDLRRALVERHGASSGAAAANRLALGALSHLARENNDLVDLLEAVLEADRRRGGGHAGAIRAAFSSHGIVATAKVELHGAPPWVR